MDIINTLTLITKLFDQAFDFHPLFYDEFTKLLIGSGSEKAIMKQFITRLKMIIELGNIDSGTKWLEQLKGYDNMYSLHLTAGNKNYRLLFSKVSNKKLFLHTFYERAGKSATSYERHVKIALDRRDRECLGGSK